MAKGPKGSGSLVNCALCGRDTRAKDGICGRCTGSVNQYASDEQKGRKARSTYILGGTAIEDIDPQEDSDGNITSSGEYHGPTIRDDI